MTTGWSSDVSLRVAHETRELFVVATRALMAPTAAAILKQLNSNAMQGSAVRSGQADRDELQAFRAVEADWVARLQRLGLNTIEPSHSVASEVRQALTDFQLIDHETVENNILASRLGLSIYDAVSFEFNDLRVRIQELEDQNELTSNDVLRPDVLATLMVGQWVATGLGRTLWTKVQQTLRRQLLPGLVAVYKEANAHLVQQGMSPEIDLKGLVRRAVPSASTAVVLDGAASDVPKSNQQTVVKGMGPMGAGPRARNVLFSLKRFVADHLESEAASQPTSGATGGAPAFLTAIADAAHEYRQGVDVDASVPTAAAFQRSVMELRRRTHELKWQAPTTADKATIEIVALMFQSILSEERIPFSARVWFARLQMPVLRVAVDEAEFFASLEHPARLLIDHMGSCVMGFDAAAVSCSELEIEIRRVVQVIEQYPETGQRVFKLVYAEFVVFLSKYLTKGDTTQRVMSIAQHVEQRETMAIQYTIELRKMLNQMPVRDEIREFLFKVWAGVLALAALRYGAQSERTVVLKRAASELVWAASAKPNRADRARVIQELPKLLQQLRQGMTLLGVVGEPQEAHIKIIGDTLADAFMLRSEAISPNQIESMASRLADIEDIVGATTDDTLPIDVASIELLLGDDAAALEVLPDTGTRVAPEVTVWAGELQVGGWFMLDHNAQMTQVQFVWRSERKQLYLFASVDGRSFLIQASRLGAYLQAGLLIPAEEEALTVRATREALAKLDANPERLLN